MRSRMSVHLLIKLYKMTGLSRPLNLRDKSNFHIRGGFPRLVKVFGICDRG